MPKVNKSQNKFNSTIFGFFFSRFRIDNTDHIIDVLHGSQINIICPYYPTPVVTNSDDVENADRVAKRAVSEEDMERFIIYIVNKEEYDMCRIMTSQPRIVAQCNAPHERNFFTLTFRSFSPMPGRLEYHPGEDYYFISTSEKGDIHKRVEGMCRTNNMRVVLKVKDREAMEAARREAAEREERAKAKNFEYFLSKTKSTGPSANDIPGARDGGKSDADSRKESATTERPSRPGSKKELVKQEASTSNSAVSQRLASAAFPLLVVVGCARPLLR